MRVLQSEAEQLVAGKHSELACLALYLMYEKKQGRNSYWYEFIAVRTILVLLQSPVLVSCHVPQRSTAAITSLGSCSIPGLTMLLFIPPLTWCLLWEAGCCSAARLNPIVMFDRLFLY